MSRLANRIELLDMKRPSNCSACDGVMVFEGLGRYRCEKCGVTEHDDYGKARNYIEQHPGANVAQISHATGVSTKSINNMVKDQRFEITASSRTFLRCEICGANIRYGRTCSRCEAAYHKQYEEDVRKSNIQGGFGKAERNEDADGAKRFRRQN